MRMKSGSSPVAADSFAWMLVITFCTAVVTLDQ